MSIATATRHLDEIDKLRAHPGLADFVFPPDHGGDWAAHMAKCHNRAGQVAIFTAARALGALLEAYPLMAAGGVWMMNPGAIKMSVHIVQNSGPSDTFHRPGGAFSIRWADDVDDSVVWKRAFSALDTTCAAALAGCCPQLNEAFTGISNLNGIAQISKRHAAELESAWEAIRLDECAPQATSTRLSRRV